MKSSFRTPPSLVLSFTPFPKGFLGFFIKSVQRSDNAEGELYIRGKVLECRLPDDVMGKTAAKSLRPEGGVGGSGRYLKSLK